MGISGMGREVISKTIMTGTTGARSADRMLRVSKADPGTVCGAIGMAESTGCYRIITMDIDHDIGTGMTTHTIT